MKSLQGCTVSPVLNSQNIRQVANHKTLERQRFRILHNDLKHSQDSLLASYSCDIRFNLADGACMILLFFNFTIAVKML